MYERVEAPPPPMLFSHVDKDFSLSSKTLQPDSAHHLSNLEVSTVLIR
jgi:hypothetical protein